MSEPVVSVVISVFNAGALLPQAMRSVLDQEGVDFEIVVVDDGSTDGSGEALDRYAREDPRVRVLHQENAGLTKALIRGCSQARGELIARQDVDDVSLPGRLEKQARLLRSDPSLAMVSSGVGDDRSEWRAPLRDPEDGGPERGHPGAPRERQGCRARFGDVPKVALRARGRLPRGVLFRTGLGPLAAAGRGGASRVRAGSPLHAPHQRQVAQLPLCPRAGSPRRAFARVPAGRGGKSDRRARRWRKRGPFGLA